MRFSVDTFLNIYVNQKWYSIKQIYICVCPSSKSCHIKNHFFFCSETKLNNLNIFAATRNEFVPPPQKKTSLGKFWIKKWQSLGGISLYALRKCWRNRIIWQTSIRFFCCQKRYKITKNASVLPKQHKINRFSPSETEKFLGGKKIKMKFYITTYRYSHKIFS